MGTLLLPFRALVAAVVVAVPLLAAWLASSLAVYANGPVWIALFAALVCFPIVPVAWELQAIGERRRRGGKSRFGFVDRVLARTLLVNLVVLVGLLAVWPDRAFAALSTRGDWMLEQRRGPEADRLRSGLFWVADRLEWLYVAARADNPFERWVERRRPPPPPAARRASLERAPASGTELAGLWGSTALPRPEPTAAPPPVAPAPSPEPIGAGAVAASSARHLPGVELEPADPAEAEVATPAAAEPPIGALAEARVDRDPESGVPRIVVHEDVDALRRDPAARVDPSPAWPTPAVVDPAVLAGPSRFDSAEALGRWARSAETPRATARRLHDWIARHVRYDQDAAAPGAAVPDQSPDAVLARGTAVCAGYARLFEASATAAGLEAATVLGVSRGGGGGPLDGTPHAWSAVRVDGSWRLLDVTWAAGQLVDGRWVQRFSTDDLFAPPEIFARLHLPEDPRWQLLEPPLSRGEFLRAPMLRPGFDALGLSLPASQRSQLDAVDGRVELRVEGPPDVKLVGELSGGGAAPVRCERAREAGGLVLRCAPPSPGRWTLRLYAAPESAGALPLVGELHVNAR